MYLIELNDRDFEKFRDLVYAEAGIKLSDLKKALLQARLSRRLRALGIKSYTEYYTYLMDNYENEKIEFINSLTTNKTDFFRENRHFEFMKEIVLPAYEGKNEIKIWSAGCSTGEEPYTIAMTMNDYYSGIKKAQNFKILATDIDTRVLESAREGVYKWETVDEIPLPTLKKYFSRGKGENQGVFKIKDILKKNIYFRRLNLLDQVYPMKGQFDIIFCRNVIIYFDKDTQRRLFAKFASHLAEDGYLFIGHSENISGITDRFRLIGSTIYQKV
jgi:chemotaxis protein methyltransferase CheR